MKANRKYLSISLGRLAARRVCWFCYGIIVWVWVAGLQQPGQCESGYPSNQYPVPAGILTPGTSAYPVGDIPLCGSMRLGYQEVPACAVVDGSTGFAYVGMGTGAPGRILKIALGAESSTLTRASILDLSPDEGSLLAASIDSERGHAYFVASGTLCRLIKVRLGAGSASPAKLDSTVLPYREDSVKACLLDSSRGYIYLVADGQPARIAKISIKDAKASPRWLGELALDDGENEIWCALGYMERGYAYLGRVNGGPTRLIKVALPSDDALPRRLGALDIAPEDGVFGCGVLDKNSNEGYFGMSSGSYSPGCILKVSLGQGHALPVRMSRLVLAEGEWSPRTAAIDPGKKQAYFAIEGGNLNAALVRISLEPGASAPRRLGSAFFNAEESGLRCSVLSPSRRTFVAGCMPFASDGPAIPKLVKFALGDGAMPLARQGALALEVYDGIAVGLAVDSSRGIAALTTRRTQGVQAGPVEVVKVLLGKSNELPRRIASLQLEDRQWPTALALFDGTRGHAYFGTKGSPGKIIKIRMGANSSDPMTWVGSLALNPSEGEPVCGFLDPMSGYGWIGTSSSAGIIVKIALGADNESPRRLGLLNLGLGDSWPTAAIADLANRRGYFTTAGGRLVKFALGEGSAPPFRIGAANLPPNEYPVTAAVSDTQTNQGYFGSATYYPSISKFALGMAAAMPNRLGSATFNPVGGGIVAAGIDLPARFAYFADVSSIVRVNLLAGQTNPGVVAQMRMNAWDGDLVQVAADSDNGYLYYTGNQQASAAWFGKMDLRTSSPLRALNMLQAGTEETGYGTMLVDAQKGYAYAGTYDLYAPHPQSKARIVKFAIGQGNEPVRRVGALDLNPDEMQIRAGVLDADRGYAYFCPLNNSGKIIKVRLAKGDMPPVRAAEIEVGQSMIECAGGDPKNGFAYFAGTEIGIPYVYKIWMTAGDGPPVFVAKTSLGQANITILRIALVDPDRGHAYFAASSGFLAPARIIKVALGAGDAKPKLLGSVELAAGEAVPDCGGIDPKNGYAYFGTVSSPPRIVKVALGSASALPRRIGSIALDKNDGYQLQGVVMDCDNGYGYFTGEGIPQPRIIKVELGKGAALPKRIGAMTALGTNRAHLNGILDSQNGCMLFPSGSLMGGAIAKYAYSHKNYIKAVRISVGATMIARDFCFYSHRAAGNVRLAIYDGANPKRLLWQSPSLPNRVNEGWLNAPISLLTDSKNLLLRPGDYWLAFQTDTAQDVPSYIRGSSGDGYCADFLYGAFPATMPDGTSNPDRYAMHLTLAPASAKQEWNSYR